MLDNGKRKGSAMNIEIAQRLYELRRKHGFSQESLAAELGLSRQAISKWERSESAPDMGNLIALADLYGMTIDELIRPAVKDDLDPYTEAPSGTAMAAETVESVEVMEVAEMAEGTEAAAPAEAVAVVAALEAPEGAAAAEADEKDAKAPEGSERQQPTAAAEVSQSPQPASPNQEDAKQVYAHGHIYAKPTGTDAPPRCALRRFPYPLLVLVIFLILALVFGMWEYIWLFLTIPFYYWIARVIERDPIFLERHGYAPSATEADSAAQNDYASAYAVGGKGAR